MSALPSPGTPASRPTPWPRALGLVLAMALTLLSACGSPTAKAPAPGSSTAGSNLACSGHPGGGQAAVVVQAGAGQIVSRCLRVGSSSISALSALQRAGIHIATQSYSFGLAVCQIDDVPAHYTKCLPSGQPYWASFLASPGHGWTSATSGISDITLRPGDSLGFRYDPQSGSAAPPSVAPPLR